MDARPDNVVLPTSARPVSAEVLLARMTAFPGPVVLDVRREPVYAAADRSLPGALRRDPEALLGWAGQLEPLRPVVAVCAFGHNVSHDVAEALSDRGFDATYLDGGIAAWTALGFPLAPKPAAASVWVTRARPKVDRVACPWFIRRFMDPDARFVFVPPRDVTRVAAQSGGTAFDIPGAPYTHADETADERCTFDAFVARHRPDDPALSRLASIVRGADTSRPQLHPAAAGLFATALGMSALVADDAMLLRTAFPLYDALYLWCRDLQEEVHAWPPTI
jgi:rhodanese-related sulfurtransferase